MTKTIKLITPLFLLCFICVFCLKSTVCAAEYTSGEFVTGHYTDRNSRIFSKGNKLLHIDWSGKKKNGRSTTNIVITTIYENGRSVSKNILQKGKTYPIKPQKSGLYTYTKENNKLVIKTIDKKGRVKASYSIDNKKKKYIGVCDVIKKDGKLYYVLDTTKNVYIQCYDIKKKQIISTINGGSRQGSYYQYNDNKLYLYIRSEGIIEERTLDGKKMLHSYKLPDGNTEITAYPSHLNNHPVHYNFVSLDFKGRYIYYCNRNGIYRCDTKADKQFELIYDGSNDVIFNPINGEGLNLDEFKVLDNGDFYIFLGDYEDSEHKKYYIK